MIISSKSILSYLGRLQFPVEVRAEKGDEVIFRLSQSDLMALIEVQAVIGIGSWKKIKWFRLNRPTEEISILRLKKQCRPSAEDNKTTVVDGRTIFHHKRRSEAFWGGAVLPITDLAPIYDQVLREVTGSLA